MSGEDPFGLQHDLFEQLRQDDSTEAELARLLGVPTHSLLLAAGGPWSSGWERSSPLLSRFAGRAGMSVALEVRTIDRAVEVGPAIWHRQFPYPVWTLGEPMVSLTLPGQEKDSQQEFLERLGDGVDAAARLRPRTRVVCRVCASILPKALMFSREMCDGCASSTLGVVF